MQSLVVGVTSWVGVCSVAAVIVLWLKTSEYVAFCLFVFMSKFFPCVLACLFNWFDMWNCLDVFPKLRLDQ